MLNYHSLLKHANRYLEDTRGNKMIQKHAYLILAYNNLYVLEKCIELLEYPMNDIFVHLDVKTSNAEHWIKRIQEKFSRVIFIERKNVKWADYSQTNAELELLKAAIFRGGVRLVPPYLR